MYTDHQTLVLSFIPYLKSDNRVSDVLSWAQVPEVLQVEVAEEELVMSKIRNVQRSDDEKVYRLFRGD